jgi:hypothetical protein
MTTTTKEEQDYARTEILVNAKRLIAAELDDPGPTPDEWHQFARAVHEYLDAEIRLEGK